MNRSDRRVLMALLLVGIVTLVAIFLLGGEGNDSVSRETRRTRNTRSSRIPYAVSSLQQPETFFFDPNTADSTQLLRLGLQPWQVRNIYRYRAKGGVYHRKEDFARLYGLTVKDYRRLEPYIRISSDYLPAATLVGEDRNYSNDSHYSKNRKDSSHYAQKIREGEHIILNIADTILLRKVPGIGSYYAKEIHHYGQLLGGFVDVNQLDEIDGFPSEAKKYFEIENAAPRKLNVNKLTLQQLRRHPYINFYQAKAITDYRRLHGTIKNLRELRLSSDFTDEDFRRLEPYVEY
ncbi:MAG: helix-hairpin-helix domain-containing protein [Prevotella sp.]|nr:helix-hairpin-helix domain-containing protein [Prevotella sp.]